MIEICSTHEMGDSPNTSRPSQTGTAAAGTGAGFGCLVAAGLLLAGPCFFVWQCYHWMRDGAWWPVSLLTALAWAGVGGTWILFPTDWLGLHKLLDGIPLSIALVAAGIFVLWAVEKLRLLNSAPSHQK